jgi:uncharacterized membrane protein
MKTRSLLFLLALAACEPATAPTGAPTALDRAPAPIYTVTSLGVLPGQGSSQANAINDLGVIVGQSGHQAFWYRSGLLGPLATLPGATTTVATDINSAGHIVGYVLDAEQAVMWNSTSSPATPIISNGFGHYAMAINDFDVVVGGGFVAGPTDQHAFRWSAAAGLTDLNPSWASTSLAYDIDNTGMITGYATYAATGRTYAVTWNPAGTVTVVGILVGGDFATGYAQRSGRVVGSSMVIPGSSATVGFQWTAATGMTQVAGFGAIYGLSAGQRIVGWAAGAGGLQSAVTRLLSVPGVTTLPSLGGSLSQARAVNGCGKIAGFSTTTLGARRAVVWQAPSCDP